MGTSETLEARREKIIREMLSIRSMRKGTINEQYLKVRRVGRKEAVECGPYYVLSRREGNKTVSQRLTTVGELEQARRDVAEHQKFVALCKEYEEVTEKLGEMERGGMVGEEKKGRKWSSKKKRK